MLLTANAKNLRRLLLVGFAVTFENLVSRSRARKEPTPGNKAQAESRHPRSTHLLQLVQEQQFSRLAERAITSVSILP